MEEMQLWINKHAGYPFWDSVLMQPQQKAI